MKEEDIRDINTGDTTNHGKIQKELAVETMKLRKQMKKSSIVQAVLTGVIAVFSVIQALIVSGVI